MGILLTFAWGLALGSTGGFAVGLFTADEANPRQQAIRAYVRRIWQEAREASEEEERRQLEAYRRLTGVS